MADMRPYWGLHNSCDASLIRLCITPHSSPAHLSCADEPGITRRGGVVIRELTGDDDDDLEGDSDLLGAWVTKGS